ncbi:MAG: hypothetical protein IBX45_06460 [Campylobacterales bacterium]|nr:hypothetical protein [Campylobacterales bacterium]
MSHLWGEFIQHLNTYQKALNTTLASSFRTLDEQGLSGALLLIGISFLYGVVHAVGPGHGKAVVASYFLTHGKKVQEALKIGYLVAIFHTFSATVLTFGIYFFIEGVFSRTFNQSVATLYKVSGGMVLLVGVYLAYELVRDWKRKEEPSLSTQKPLVVAFSIGIVPCPGVMTVLLFSLLLGHLVTGIFAAIAMGIGMGLTISVAGIVSIRSSHLIKARSRVIEKTLQLLSVLFILGIGLVLIA